MSYLWRSMCQPTRYSRRFVKSVVDGRWFCSRSITQEKTSIDINKIPLSDVIPGLPTVVGSESITGKNETEVTTLSNGLRVATEHKFGTHCTVGVVVDSGSRYEVAFPSGVSHFLEKLAFGATKHFKDRDEIMSKLEKYGGICDCQHTKDISIYAISAESRYASDVVGLLSDSIWQPLLPEEEIEIARLKIQYELEDINQNPQKEAQLMEMVHSAAYRQNTLGLPKICPQENIPKINRSLLYTFLKLHFDPSRLVLAGVGVDHQRLVEAAQKYFVDTNPIWNENPSLIVPGEVSVDQSISQYTGGQCLIEEDLSNVSLGPTPMPELAHVTIALESCSHQSKDFVPTCVLNTLMGGGGSFSAGGPGKGMYSRLYTRVLNKCHWMYNSTAYNHSYMDSGIFCIYASAHPMEVHNLCETVVREMTEMAGVLDSTELARAKKQLKSMLLMNLEARPVQFEDIGRQVLATGNRKQPGYFIDAINRVTVEDVQRVARHILHSKPSMAALGSLKHLPSLQEVAAGLQGQESRKKRFSLF